MKLVFSFFLLLVSLGSHAARKATIDVEEVEVYLHPDASSDVVGTLSQGSEVAASNVPTRGFFKIRLPNGRLGWITREALVLEAAPDLLVVEESYEAQQGRDASGGDLDSNPEGRRKGEVSRQSLGRKSPSAPAPLRSSLRLFGGLSFFRLQEVTAATGIQDPLVGVSYGGEFTYPIGSQFLVGLRLEQVRKTSSIKSISDGQIYQLDMVSSPVMVGAAREFFVSDRSIMLSVGLYAGLGFNTQFVSTAISQDEPNATVLEASALAGLLYGSAHWFMGESFGLLFEVAYRYLKTGQVTPLDEVNGSDIFANGAQFVPIPLNFSGFLSNVGLVFRF